MADEYAQFENFLARGVLSNADAVARRMVGLQPAGELANVALARVLMAQNKPADAVKTLQKINPEKNRFATALCFLGEAHLMLKEDAPAQACAAQAVALAPDLPATLRLHGKMLVKAAKHDEAVTTLGNLVKTAAAEPEDWRLYATALRKTKRPDAAVQALQHVLAGRPNDVNAWMDTISARMEAGEAEKAMTELQTLMTKNPRNADVLKFANTIRQAGTSTSNPLAGEIAAVRDELDAGDLPAANARLQTLLKYHRPTRALKFIMEELAMAAPGANLVDIKVRLTDLNKQYKEAWEPRALMADLLLRSNRATDATPAITYAEEAWSMSGGNPRVGLVLVRAYKTANKLPYANALAAQLRALSPTVAARVDKILKG